MENRTRFNLVDSLENWKKNLSRSHIMTADNIQELESHLLDEMDNLTSKGLGEEEAFIMATKQIGTKKFLVAEFSKVSVFNTILFKCMPLLQCLLFYFIYRRSISVEGYFADFLIVSFNLDFINTHIVVNDISMVVSLLGLLVAAYYLIRDHKKGKSAARLFNNIPLFIGGFLLLMLTDISYYKLVAEGTPINEYMVSMRREEIFFIIVIFATTFFLLLDKMNKRKIALK